MAKTFRLKSLFFSLIRTTGGPPWVMLVATAVVVSETFFVVSFFGTRCANVCCVALMLFTVVYITCLAFAVHRQMTCSHTIENVDALSSFIYFYWFELFTSPNGVMSVLEGTFKVPWFAWIFSVWSESTSLQFIAALRELFMGLTAVSVLGCCCSLLLKRRLCQRCLWVRYSNWFIDSGFLGMLGSVNGAEKSPTPGWNSRVVFGQPLKRW